MSPSTTHRPVARARAEAYEALALVFRLPTLCWCRGLRRVITALGRVMLWYPQPLLEEQVGALRLWLREPGSGVTEEQRRLFGGSAFQALIGDLERMATSCAREASAWTVDDGAAARRYLLQQRSLLRSLNRTLSGVAEAGNDKVYGILLRIARRYAVLDERLVAALLVASGGDRVADTLTMRARGRADTRRRWVQ